jgi:hypothetical protein
VTADTVLLHLPLRTVLAWVAGYGSVWCSYSHPTFHKLVELRMVGLVDAVADSGTNEGCSWAITDAGKEWVA